METAKKESIYWVDMAGKSSDIVSDNEDKQIILNGLERIRNTLLARSSTPKTQKYALIMKGGGVKGLAYLGAIKELQKHYNFDHFAGTSAGAITATFLGAGFSNDELIEIMKKKSFSSFLDNIINIPSNILDRRSLHSGEKVSVWINKSVADRLSLQREPELVDLVHDLSLYASMQDKSSLEFSTRGRNNYAIGYATRCSMSIPYFFQRQYFEGKPVYDGGIQNNYPVEEFLKSNPSKPFLGLYLKRDYTGKRRTSQLKSLIDIILEGREKKNLREHEKSTIFIDPHPISTLSFRITDEEKEFLINCGRIGALKYLTRNGIETRNIQQDLNNHKRAKKRILNKSRCKRWTSNILTIPVTILLIVVFLLTWKKIFYPIVIIVLAYYFGMPYFK